MSEAKPSAEQSPAPSYRRAPWQVPLQLLLILLLGSLAYANTFSVPFIFDDISSIVDNPAIQDLGRFLSGEGYAYNPRRFVGYLTFALNYRFGGLDVFGYHLVNLAIHLASGLLVYALARLAMKAASPVNGERGMVNGEPSPCTRFIPLFAALLFVLHPVQTQAVTYIVQRLASLATMFYLGSVVAYAYGRHEAVNSERGKVNNTFHPETGTRSPLTIHHSPYLWYALALISGLLALKTKEIAVTLPLAVILYEFCFYGFSRKKLLILLAPLLLGGLAAAIGIAGSGRPLGELLSDVTEMSRETTAISRLDYLVTQFSVIATYLRLLLLPLGQNLDYDYPVYTSLLQARPLLGLLLHLSLIGAALWAWRKAATGTGDRGPGISTTSSPFTLHHSLIAFGILWFYLTLLVESSLIPISDVIYEHRLYLPSVGMFLAAAAFLETGARKAGRKTVLAAGAVVVLAFMAATVARNRVWNSQLSIWSDAVAKSPAKARPHSNLGKALHDAGDEGNAIAHLQMALRLDSGDPYTHFNIGVYLESMDQFQLASNAYRRAMLLQPGFTRAMGNLANSLILMGQTDEAVAVLQEALHLEPGNPTFLNSLGVALLARGDADGAAASLQEAIRVMPGYDKAHLNLGRVYQSLGRHDLAAREFGIANAIAGGNVRPQGSTP
jgi:Flp pilus assembly protein TadD